MDKNIAQLKQFHYEDQKHIQKLYNITSALYEEIQQLRRQLDEVLSSQNPQQQVPQQRQPQQGQFQQQQFRQRQFQQQQPPRQTMNVSNSNNNNLSAAVDTLNDIEGFAESLSDNKEVKILN